MAIARFSAVRPRAFTALPEEFRAISFDAKTATARHVSQDVRRQFDRHVPQRATMVANQVIVAFDDGIVSRSFICKINPRNHSLSLQPVQ